MLFKRKMHVSPVCPETNKILKPNKKRRWVMWLLPITGLLAFIWFLIRVIPKPSRAAYPCQRVAFPLASGFVIWITGVIVSSLAYRKAKRLFHQSRYVTGGICVAVAIMAIWLSLSITSNNSAKAAFTPTDPPNNPMGVAKGIHPGRVVWVYEPDATSWDGSAGGWWGANNTGQNTVDYMISKAMQGLTEEPNDPNAWDALFRHFNQAKGKGDVGYQAPEKIVIKINENNQNNPYAIENVAIDALPQMVRSLLRQLVYQAGVPQTAIIVYDAMRPISDPVYNRCHPEFPDVDYRSGHGYPNQLSPNFTWVSNAITYSVGYTASDGRSVPQCVLDAEYIINMAILKKHGANIGVTLCFKNHLGTIGTPSGLHDQGYWQSFWGMNAYDLLVDITGHEDIGAKTVLYIIDGLYGSKDGVCEAPTKWASGPFNNDWPSSIFVSQDPVAIDSVGLDFLRAETGSTLLGNADNYLHEAALANDPCSGTFYDPEGDATRLESLGVHEHWNNSTDKQYSRNLETGNGIELVALLNPIPDGDFDKGGIVDFNDLGILVRYWVDRNYPEQGLVGYWKLDEGTGSIAHDSSGYDNDGTLNGDPNWVAGWIGSYALDFDADGDYVNVPDIDGSLDIDSNLTIAAWVRLNSVGAHATIVNKQPSGTAGDNYPGNYTFFVYSSTGTLRLAHQTTTGTTSQYYESTTAVSVGDWDHVAVTLVEGDSVKFYIDGSPAGTSPQTTTFGILNDEPVRIGVRKDMANGFNGRMDDVCIYNRALSKAEIHQYYSVDINHDGEVNFLDFAIFAKNWLAGIE